MIANIAGKCDICIIEDPVLWMGAGEVMVELKIVVLGAEIVDELEVYKKDKKSCHSTNVKKKVLEQKLKL